MMSSGQKLELLVVKAKQTLKHFLKKSLVDQMRSCFSTLPTVLGALTVDRSFQLYISSDLHFLYQCHVRDEVA